MTDTDLEVWQSKYLFVYLQHSNIANGHMLNNSLSSLHLQAHVHWNLSSLIKFGCEMITHKIQWININKWYAALVRWMKRKIIAEKKWCYQRGNSFEFARILRHACDNWMCSLNCHCCIRYETKQICLAKKCQAVSQPHPMRHTHTNIDFDRWHEINWVPCDFDETKWNERKREQKWIKFDFFPSFNLSAKKTYYEIFSHNFLSRIAFSMKHQLCGLTFAEEEPVFQEWIHLISLPRILFCLKKARKKSFAANM